MVDDGVRPEHMGRLVRVCRDKRNGAYPPYHRVGDVGRVIHVYAEEDVYLVKPRWGRFFSAGSQILELVPEPAPDAHPGMAAHLASPSLLARLRRHVRTFR